jgi:uncharacterized protein YkwD
MASTPLGRVHRALAICALASAAIGAPAAQAAPLTRSEMASRITLLKEMNATRINHGLRPLRMSRVLNRPAVRHSQFLARTGLLQHEGSNGSPFYVRLYGAGFSRRKAVGENLGMIGGCSLDASKVMIRMWLDSPSHRRNLLDPSYRVVGLAVVRAANCDQTVYTTDFGG